MDFSAPQCHACFYIEYTVFLMCMRLECTIICYLTYLQRPTVVVFDGRGPMFRACVKSALENGTNEGEPDAIKMYKLQKLAR